MGDELKPERRERTKQKHGLQTLMLTIVYCALTFQIGRPAVETGTPDAISALAAWLGLGMVVLGSLALSRSSNDQQRGLAAIAVGLGILVTCVAALGGFGAVVAFALMIAVGVAILLGQKAEGESLLWTLAIAARHGMPLADGVSAFARQSGRWGRARGIALAGQLEEGVPLPQAMRMSKGLIPEEGVLAAAIGLETNTLAESLGEAAAGLAGRRELLGPVVRRLVYLGMLLSITQSILAFLVYFVVPKMTLIMSDFDMPMTPRSTTILQGIWLVSSNGLAVILPLGFQLGLILLLAVGLLRLVGWRVGESWVFGWFNPGRHSVVVMRALALGIEGGQPLRETILALRKWYPPKGVRRRLAGVDQGLEQGGNWIGLLRTTRCNRSHPGGELRSLCFRKF